MKKKKTLVELISPASILKARIIRLYHGAIENIHQEIIVFFAAEGDKQFTEFVKLLKSTNKYADKHLKRLIENGIISKKTIDVQNTEVTYYFLTDDGIRLGKIATKNYRIWLREEKFLVTLNYSIKEKDKKRKATKTILPPIKPPTS